MLAASSRVRVAGRGLLVVSVALALAAPARASEADSAAAEALFREGKRLMDAGRYPDACPKLAESYRLDPATGALLATALCYERAGRLASAWAAYTEAAARAKQEGSVDREEVARGKAEELEPKLSKLVIELAPGAPVPGLSVRRDGVTVGEGVFGMALPVDPGAHVVEASAPGRKPFRAEVESAGAGVVSVSIPELAPEDSAPAVPAASPARDTGSSSEGEPGFWTPLRVTGFVVAGVGLGGVAVGSVFGVKALALNSDSKSGCDGDACQPGAFEDRTDARKAGNLSTAFFAGGLALAATGVVLVLAGGPSDRESSAFVTPLPGGASAGFRTAF